MEPDTLHPPAPPPATDGRWLTLSEAEEHFGIKRRTLRYWLAQKKIHGYHHQQEGRVELRIWSVAGEAPAPPADSPSTSTPCALPVPAQPPAEDVVTIAREQFSELLARHELACRRIGALEEALASRLPALEDGQRIDRESVAILAKSLATLEEGVPALSACSRRHHRRLQGVVVALLVLALALAAVGVMALGHL